jgi:hypothetical protein
VAGSARGALDELQITADDLRQLLGHPDERVRRWAEESLSGGSEAGEEAEEGPAGAAG